MPTGWRPRTGRGFLGRLRRSWRAARAVAMLADGAEVTDVLMAERARDLRRHLSLISKIQRTRRPGCQPAT